jgi:hypothetical protein
MRLRRLFNTVSILAVLTLLVQGGYFHEGQAASPVTLEGKINILWGDGDPESGFITTKYFLSTTQDKLIQLKMDEGLLIPHGEAISLNHKSVVVQGAWVETGRILNVQTLALANGEGRGVEGVYGPQPWVSILCKFADVQDEPKDMAYFMGMYSAQYPGLDHFWRQNSYELANLAGSSAFGWYVLPHQRSYYLPNGNLDWWTAAEDCTAAANQEVDFSHYVGINLMFNAVLDCCAWGGTWYACLDGMCKYWRTTWEPPWGYENIGVIAHETGHGFGLPHSLGNCQQGYDNRWDILSDVWSNGDDPIYGTMGQHTISYHKELLGWLSSSQIYTGTVGTVRTINLERLALPQTENYLGVVVPIDGQEDHFYTLEVRQPSNDPVDYDKWLPGFAVIIHKVDRGLPEPATVIDLDGDCNTGDGGAMYIAGEIFTDMVHGISISIDSATNTGYVVTINNRFTTMESVEITDGGEGTIGDSIPFTATVSPNDASTPITYTWEATGLSPMVHVGDTVDTIEFGWDEAGMKAITVTASNAGGSVVDTHLVEIGIKIPIVSLSGPSESKIGEENVFTAAVLPEDVTLPITYTWQASEQLPITHTIGLSDTVSYVWEDPGTKVITVTATNIYGSTMDWHSILVGTAPHSVEISGPEEGMVQGNTTFNASVNPITTTLPITYVWTIDDQLTITHTSGITDEVTLSWDIPGLHSLTISASNPVGEVFDYWSIMIYIKVLLPISMRN